MSPLPNRFEGALIISIMWTKEKAKQYRKRWYQEHPEYNKKYYHEHKEEIKEYGKKHYQENKEEIKEYGKKRYQENKEKAKEYGKKYYQEHKEERNQYLKEKRKKDPKYRLDSNIGRVIRYSLKGKKIGRHWENLVGYTLQDLMKHLENLFDKNMSWDNYGSYWEIDHEKPKSLFHYIYPEDEEFKKCWALENLQPLEKSENRKKRNKIKGRIIKN